MKLIDGRGWKAGYGHARVTEHGVEIRLDDHDDPELWIVLRLPAKLVFDLGAAVLALHVGVNSVLPGEVQKMLLDRFELPTEARHADLSDLDLPSLPGDLK